MTDRKKTAPDALRTDRLLAVQNAMLTKINALEIKERAMAEPPHRDETLHWERIHLASSARIAKDMAVERGENPELAAIATALHDIGRIITGKQKDHAHQGAEPARKLLEQLGLFTDDEIRIITGAVYNHTDKDVIGTDLEEIVKDADVVDCFEFGMELPRPEQRARYQRYVQDHFGDLISIDAEMKCDNDPTAAEGSNADPVAKALTLLKILGVDEAKIIDPSHVVTAPWLKFKCQFECPLYGTRPTCPPQTPDHKETREILDRYRTGILFYRKQLADTGEIARKAARQLHLDGYYKATAFGNGCGSDDKTTVPTMEACGIDVFKTAENCGFDTPKTSEGANFIGFWGLVLVE